MRRFVIGGVGSIGRLPWVTEQNQEGAMNPPENEREARIELAAAFRIAVQFDFHEGISNHFSMLIPGAGHIYAGRAGAGVAWMATTLMGYACCFLPGLFLHGLCLVSAAQTRRNG